MDIKYTIMLFLLLANALTPSSAAWDLWTEKMGWKVNIVNQLSHNKRLFVHCKSKDDDLGPHHVQSKDRFVFRFVENFYWATTLFWCSMSKDRKSYASFDVFWSADNHEKNKNFNLQGLTGTREIIWLVRDDGIYFRAQRNYGNSYVPRYLTEEIFYRKWDKKK
jgi:hypothetical protein